MQPAKKILVTGIILLAAISAFGYYFWYTPKFSRPVHHHSFVFKENKTNDVTVLRLRSKAILAKHFTVEEGFNETHCFLLDMRLPSGKNRFFVYNLEKDSVEMAGLVAHGSGSDNGSNDLSFSNMAKSNCTSLGKYKIGQSYSGKFGLAYKLHGLDKTNSKAFERYVVLHAHACVPNDEIAPLPICQSWGCPTVSPAFLVQLKKYMDKSEAPILLWIYY